MEPTVVFCDVWCLSKQKMQLYLQCPQTTFLLLYWCCLSQQNVCGIIICFAIYWNSICSGGRKKEGVRYCNFISHITVYAHNYSKRYWRHNSAVYFPPTHMWGQATVSICVYWYMYVCGLSMDRHTSLCCIEVCLPTFGFTLLCCFPYETISLHGR